MKVEWVELKTIITNLEALKMAKSATAKEKLHIARVVEMGCINALSLDAPVLPCSLTKDEVED